MQGTCLLCTCEKWRTQWFIKTTLQMYSSTTRVFQKLFQPISQLGSVAIFHFASVQKEVVDADFRFDLREKLSM